MSFVEMCLIFLGFQSFVCTVVLCYISFVVCDISKKIEEKNEIN